MLDERRRVCVAPRLTRSLGKPQKLASNKHIGNNNNNNKKNNGISIHVQTIIIAHDKYAIDSTVMSVRLNCFWRFVFPWHTQMGYRRTRSQKALRLRSVLRRKLLRSARFFPRVFTAENQISSRIYFRYASRYTPDRKRSYSNRILESRVRYIRTRFVIVTFVVYSLIPYICF